MFAREIRTFRSALRTFALIAGIFVIGLMSTASVSLASTDPNPEIPGTVDNPLGEMCDDAVETFFREIDWITTHDSDHPRMDAHVDRMWEAWAFAEFTCGIDVGGDGEIG